MAAASLAAVSSSSMDGDGGCPGSSEGPGSSSLSSRTSSSGSTAVVNGGGVAARSIDGGPGVDLSNNAVEGPQQGSPAWREPGRSRRSLQES